MTAFAMGAATRPPVASLPRLPPCSTMTATATRGSSAGANAVNQACGASSVGGLRGAGLAGHLHAGDLRGGAGAALDDADHHVAQRRGRAGRDRGRVQGRARSRATTVQVGRADASARGTASSAARRWRSPRRPSPSAAASPARRAARSPTARSAARSCSSGNTLSATCIGMVRSGSLNPNRSACSRSASAPRSMPSCANAVLQEMRSASASVIGSVAARRAAEVADASRWSAAGRARSGAGSVGLGRVLPALERRRGGDELERRAGRVPLLRSRCCAAGCPSAAASAWYAALAAAVSCVASGVRVEAGRARPARGSRRSTGRSRRRRPAGRRARRRAACCAAGSIVVSTAAPSRLAAGEEVPEAREEQRVAPAGQLGRSRRARARCGR